MDVYVDNTLRKKEFYSMALYLNDTADEIQDFFPFQANSLRNLAKKLAASNN